MGGRQVKGFRSGNLPRQPLAMSGPRSGNVPVARNHQGWSLNQLEDIAVIHIAEGRATSQVSNRIRAQEN